ncbi:MAG: hypothetical protein AAGE52_15810 [Myxococcota bacterium]
MSGRSSRVREGWMVVLLSVAGCVGEIGSVPSRDVGIDASDGPDSARDESCDVHRVFAANGCTRCHDSTPSEGAQLDLLSPGLAERLRNRPSMRPNCGVLVHNTQVDESLLLRLIAPETFPVPPECDAPRMPPGRGASVSAEDVRCVESWIHTVTDGVEPPPVIDPAPFEPAPVETVVSKVKYLLHGGAVTDSELSAVTGPEGELDVEALRSLIDTWMWRDGALTPAFDTKLELFFRLALQQDGVDSNRLRMIVRTQLGLTVSGAESGVDGQVFANSMPEMFLRTARGLAYEHDLRELVTTRRWHVTTALLTALVHADDSTLRLRDAGRFAAFAHLEERDYADWRPVNLAQASESEPPSFEYTNSAALAEGLRAIGPEGTLRLRVPRVGFFNTFSFFDRWDTNADNQFRVTTSQTLIVALDSIFEPGDATVPASLDGLNAEHAEEAACFACHSLLDPMREVFPRYYTYGYRPAREVRTANTTFAFQGHVVPTITSMDDLAIAIADHPRFAAAWVQKLCMWANSQRCDETSPEFERVTELFRIGYDPGSPDDDFRLRILFRELFSSTLVTGASDAPAHERVEFTISATRYGHFCQAMNARLRQACGDTGPCLAPEYSCFGGLPVARSLGEDDYQRGVRDFTTPSSMDPMHALSAREACRRVARDAVGRGRLFSRDGDTEATIERIVETVMGLPSSHSRHRAAVEGLQRMYRILVENAPCPEGENFITANEGVSGGAAVCGPGLGPSDALSQVFAIACSAPEVTGIGL